MNTLTNIPKAQKSDVHNMLQSLLLAVSGQEDMSENVASALLNGDLGNKGCTPMRAYDLSRVQFTFEKVVPEGGRKSVNIVGALLNETTFSESGIKEEIRASVIMPELNLSGAMLSLLEEGKVLTFEAYDEEPAKG